MIFTDGFFDAGMLLQALKANEDEKDRPTAQTMSSVASSRRSAVGKKLRLGDY